MDVILDANIYLSDPRMESIKFKGLFDYLRRTNSFLVVPRLVREETISKHRRMTEASARKVEQAVASFNRLILDPHSQVRFTIPDPKFQRRGLMKKFRAPAKHVKTKYYPDVSGVDVQEVFMRGINRRRPASDAGEELRDVILWMVVIQYAKTEDKPVAFVTADQGFWQDSEVHEHIRDDISKYGVNVRLFSSIEDFIKGNALKALPLDRQVADRVFDVSAHSEAIISATRNVLGSSRYWQLSLITETIRPLTLERVTFHEGTMYESEEGAVYAELSYDIEAFAEVASSMPRIEVAPTGLPEFLGGGSLSQLLALGTGLNVAFPGPNPPASKQVISRVKVIRGRVSFSMRLVNGVASEVELEKVDVSSVRDAQTEGNSEAPKGYRDLVWGSPPSDQLRKIKDLPDNVAMYQLAAPKDKHELFGMSPAEEAYLFAKGRFFSGSAWFDGADSLRKMKDALIDGYGEPTFVNERLNLWKWKWPRSAVEISLSFQERFSKTTVTYTNDSI